MLSISSSTIKPDRQKCARAPFEENVIISPVIESPQGDCWEVLEKTISAKGLNISEGGIRLEWKAKQWLPSILKIRFHLHSLTPLVVYAKLIWKKGNACGFQYIVLDNTDRNQIKNYVNQLFY